uniref:SH2 domain-containing protein n=1 Tax=Panagrolaimus superbus TaxID=310955 RepID=A0A914Z8Q7_9BILA
MLFSNLYQLLHERFKPRRQHIQLKDEYDLQNLAFIEYPMGDYLLRISSNFTPSTNCLFFTSWPKTVQLQVPHHSTAATKASIEAPPNYEIFDEKCVAEKRCETLNQESGISFPDKGIVEFAMALIDQKKTFELFHPSGIHSPIYTIEGIFSCTDYTTNISFNDLGFILFKRKSDKIDIEMEFKPNAQNELGDKNLISRESNIQFYFYKNLLNIFFFDPDDNFRMRTFILPEGIIEKMENSTTKIHINHTNADTFCSPLGNNVKLLLPKYAKLTSTNPPISKSTVPSIFETTKDASSMASFPLAAIIAICW